MESEWITGDDEAAADVWRKSHSRWGWVVGRLFTICLIAAILTGDLWPKPLGLPVGIAIMVVIPVIGGIICRRRERIDVPVGLTGIRSDRLPAVPVAVYDDSDDGPVLREAGAMLWRRGAAGSFTWPVRADGTLALGLFETDGDRIRMTGTRDIDPEALAMIAKDANSFDKAFPHPSVTVDDTWWIAYDPDGQLPRK